MIFDYRYKPSGPVRRPSCDHNTKKLKCATLTASDVQKFYSLYYKNAERSHQNNFLLQHMKTTKVTRHRNKTRPPHKVSSKYFVRNRKRDEVPVCLKAFCQILQVNRFKLQRLAKKNFETGDVSEQRGGFKKSVIDFNQQRESISTFLNSLPYTESHYCREKSQRKYLTPELNVSKLYNMFRDRFQSDDGNIPKKSYFRFIFNTAFNFGFGSPKKDECSTCTFLTERIKHEKST